MIRIAQPQIGQEERDAVMAVLDSGMLVSASVTREFEEAFATEVSGTRHAVAVSNGTAALHLALLAHNIGAGDEVITTPFTFQATANMILAVGARPVFVDVREDANIDPGAIAAAITPRTKAIMPVHLYGRLCDMAIIGDIASRHGLAVIEDAAQAHGARSQGRAAGSFDTGCFSFYATKNMMTGEGGMLTTDDASLADRLRRLRAHGESERYNSIEVGFNYRITDLQSAIGRAQLRRLPAMTAARRRNAAYLSAHLSGVGLPQPPVVPGAMVWHQYTIRAFGAREDLQRHLRQHDIESVVYYPRVLPEQPLYRDLGYSSDRLPVACRLSREVLSLPVHAGLSQADLEKIVSAVNAWTPGTGEGQPATATAPA